MPTWIMGVYSTRPLNLVPTLYRVQGEKRRSHKSPKRFSFFWLQVSLFLSASFCLFFESFKKSRSKADMFFGVWGPVTRTWLRGLREVNGCYTKTERVVNEAPVFVNRHGIILFRLGFFRGLSWSTLGRLFSFLSLDPTWVDPGTSWDEVHLTGTSHKMAIHRMTAKVPGKNLLPGLQPFEMRPRIQDPGCNRGK